MSGLAKVLTFYFAVFAVMLAAGKLIGIIPFVYWPWIGITAPLWMFLIAVGLATLLSPFHDDDHEKAGER